MREISDREVVVGMRERERERESYRREIRRDFPSTKSPIAIRVLLVTLFNYKRSSG